MKSKPQPLDADAPQGMSKERAEELEKINSQPSPFTDQTCDACGMVKASVYRGLCRYCTKEIYD